jgi:hypothetical protein
MSSRAPPLLIGCGILEPELRQLARERGVWLELELLGASLHLDLDRLEREFGAQLKRTAGRATAAFFGACHPRLDAWLGARGTRRTRGTNCVEMLLGSERYRDELEGGAYFLLEPFARGWAAALRHTFGDRPELAREVFQGAHTHLLAVQTPCSGDFRAEAEAASRSVGLPLRWLSVGLDHLEGVVREALQPRGAA